MVHMSKIKLDNERILNVYYTTRRPIKKKHRKNCSL